MQFASFLTSSSRSSTLWASLAKIRNFLFGIGGEFLALFLLIVPVFNDIFTFLIRTDFSKPPRLFTLISTVMFYEVLLEGDTPVKVSSDFAILHNFCSYGFKRVCFYPFYQTGNLRPHIQPSISVISQTFHNGVLLLVQSHKAFEGLVFPSP